jgi:hypothetical protein
MKFLEGKKTYITAGLLAVASFVYAMGWIDEKTLVAIDSFLGAFGLGFLRAGIKKDTQQ